jgi:aminopeptidase-like protein
MEGDKSIFDIAQELNLDYWEVRGYIEKFREKGLIDSLPILK